jgi:predicted Zn-dependent peptidase
MSITLQRCLVWLSVLLFAWNFTTATAFAEDQASSIQPYLDRTIKRINEFTLNNGLKFIVLENHDAPVISFVTYADVGGVDEPDGKTGVAHFLEHMAFKGTPTIGTLNYQQEKPLLDRLDQIAAEVRKEKAAGNETKVNQLNEKLLEIEAEAKKFVKQNEYGQIVEQSGGVGLNAATTTEATIYFYSFPANKLELWMSLESERFLQPVFREFYKEQQVILEERRLRTDNSPIGKTIEAFIDKAFTVHPYRRPVIGYDEDIRNLDRQDIQDFYETHYPPSNLTIAIVGDVNPQQVKKLASVYFGRYPKGKKPAPVSVVEPPQTETREFTLKLPTQPWYFEGYHCPSINDPDNAVYQVIASLMSDGRTSRLYKSLVEDQQIALAAQGFNGFPGDKYPNLVLFYAMTAQGHTIEEVATALQAEIKRLQDDPVTLAELNRVKTKLKADLLRSLDSNMGMARLLTEYQAKTGSWRNIFRQLDQIAAVTPEDIQRVSRQTFTPENRTIGKLLNSESPQGDKRLKG